MDIIELLEPQNESVTRSLPAFKWDTKTKEIQVLHPNTFPKKVVIDWGEDNKSTGKDYAFPVNINFKWVYRSDTNRTYNLYLSEDKFLSKAKVFKNLKKEDFQIKNLKVNTVYYWKIDAENNNKTLAKSPVFVFKTDNAMPRWIEVPNVTNFRDMGGWPLNDLTYVKQGLLFRCSELNGHIEITEKGKKILIEDLKIRTDLDLRSEKEPISPILDQSKVNWINIPVLPYDNILKPEQKVNYKRIFSILADKKNYPLMFHCWGGCDRGGTLAFLILALLGAKEKYLFLDYELSSLSIWENRECDSHFFQSLIQTLEKFGPKKEYQIQVKNYLNTIGVTKEGINKLRKILIEK
jgi:protein-tyrosine phosphatase